MFNNNEKEHALCRLILEETNDSVIVTDSNGTIVFWNDSSSRIFGWDSSEMIGNNVLFIIPEEYRERHVAAFNRTLNSRKPKVNKTYKELEGIHKDGSKRIIDVSISAIENGGTYFVGILRDITEKRNAQQTAYEKAVEAKHAYEQSMSYAKDLRSIAQKLEDVQQKEFWEDVLEVLKSGRETSGGTDKDDG